MKIDTYKIHVTYPDNDVFLAGSPEEAVNSWIKILMEEQLCSLKLFIEDPAGNITAHDVKGCDLMRGKKERKDEELQVWT